MGSQGADSQAEGTELIGDILVNKTELVPFNKGVAVRSGSGLPLGWAGSGSTMSF